MYLSMFSSGETVENQLLFIRHLPLSAAFLYYVYVSVLSKFKRITKLFPTGYHGVVKLS